MSISRNGKTIGCLGSRQKDAASFVVMAEWDVNLFGPPPTALADPSHPAAKFRPVKINHFAKVSFTVGEEVQYLIVAHVSGTFPTQTNIN